MTLPQLGELQEASGFVLAGGKSSRMGRDKALLELAGAPLIMRALAILRNAGLRRAIAGAHSDLSVFGSLVQDNAFASGRGPLSGICAALAVTQARYAVFLPIDMPFLPSSLLVGASSPVATLSRLMRAASISAP